MKMKILLFAILFQTFAFAQDSIPEMDSSVVINDTAVIRQIFDKELNADNAYFVLRDLCKKYPGRLSGSKAAGDAVEYMENVMKASFFDTVYLQPVMVPHWERGLPEKAYFQSGSDQIAVNICALGGSIGTGKKPVQGNIIMVNSIDELKALPKSAVSGKIVFFNGKMDPTNIRTFISYGQAGKQRWEGPWIAQEKGASGVIVRSLTTIEDEHPHTGSMGTREGNKGIPSAAISTLHANQLSRTLKINEDLLFSMQLNCTTYKDTLSYNVIGEITGSEFPNEIIVVGGHLDAWDNGEGAHDDGAGCVQSVEALRLFKALKLEPKRTLRAVLFMNEENGLKGGKAFADSVSSKGENIIAAIESDAGGFTPRYFVCQTNDERLAHVQSWLPIFKKYNIHEVEYGHGGADISPLDESKTLLIGYRPDSQRYFDFHHAATDKFEQVNKRELQLGAANMSALLWMLSEHGVR